MMLWLMRRFGYVGEARHDLYAIFKACPWCRVAYGEAPAKGAFLAAKCGTCGAPYMARHVRIVNAANTPPST